MRKIKMKWTLATTLLIISLFAATCYAGETQEIRGDQFKVVGYYSGDLFNEPLEKLPTDKLTHVIYAFLIPQEDGSLVELAKPEQLRQIVTKAHNDGAKVYIAVGGWSYQNKPLQPVFETVTASDEKRKLLIENICGFVTEYDLDGVELLFSIGFLIGSKDITIEKEGIPPMEENFRRWLSGSFSTE